MCFISVCVFVLREKFIRLQHENKMLRVQQEDSKNERIAALQMHLEEALRSRSGLDTENRYHTATRIHLRSTSFTYWTAFNDIVEIIEISE